MATLRAAGKRFDVDAFLKGSTLKARAVRRRGHPRSASRPAGPKNTFSNINFDVSNAAWTDWNKQVKDAERFLVKHQKELRRLSRFPGMESFGIDFPVEVSEKVWNGETYLSCAFPLSLLQKATALGLKLEISIYTGQTE
jgi:hypothetical protein